MRRALDALLVLLRYGHRLLMLLLELRLSVLLLVMDSLGLRGLL